MHSADAFIQSNLQMRITANVEANNKLHRRKPRVRCGRTHEKSLDCLKRGVGTARRQSFDDRSDRVVT